MKINSLVVTTKFTDGNTVVYTYLPNTLATCGYPISLTRKQSILWFRNYFVNRFEDIFYSAYVQFDDGSTAFITPKGFTCQLTCNFE